MALTVEEIRGRSLHERTKALTDDQIQSLLDITEQLILGTGVNKRTTGFEAIFNNGQTLAFDWLLENPSFTRMNQQGRYSESYSLSLPHGILQVLAPISGGFGRLVRPRGHHHRGRHVR